MKKNRFNATAHARFLVQVKEEKLAERPQLGNGNDNTGDMRRRSQYGEKFTSSKVAYPATARRAETVDTAEAPGRAVGDYGNLVDSSASPRKGQIHKGLTLGPLSSSRKGAIPSN